MQFLKGLIKLVFLISFTFFVFSYFKKDNLPDKEYIVDNLYQEPLQTVTALPPFTVEKEGVVYSITPLYEYELYGMAVSYHHSKTWWDYYHDRWEDFINIKDICVIWGENIKTEVYKEMEFSNGSWTCYFDFKPGTGPDDWSKFKNEFGSNNHLLSDDKRVSQKIMDVERGDQVYLKGYLVEYSHGGGFKRGSSVTRTDRGNGACETVYVTDFQILKKASPFWSSINYFSKYLAIASFVIMLLYFFFSPTGYRTNQKI